MDMPSNLLADLPPSIPHELFQVLVEHPRVRIERIVSHGQSSPPGFWYDQAWAEWVLLLQGRARVRLEAENRLIELIPGGHLLIPAGVRHRVDWTDPDQRTIWLAVHFGEGEAV